MSEYACGLRYTGLVVSFPRKPPWALEALLAVKSCDGSIFDPDRGCGMIPHIFHQRVEMRKSTACLNMPAWRRRARQNASPILPANHEGVGQDVCLSNARKRTPRADCPKPHARTMSHYVLS